VATVGKGMHARKDGRAGRWGVLRGRAPGSHWRRRQLRLGRALRVVGTGIGAIGLAVALLGQSGVVSAPATQLAAKSTSPKVTLTPSSYDFGTIPSGQTATETFTVTSDAKTSVSFGTIALLGSEPGDFSLANTCPGTLNPGSTCRIQVGIPTTDTATDGRVSAVLDVPITDGPTLSSTVSVTISPADQPIASVSPSTLDFGNVTYNNSKVRTVTVENLGAAPLTFGTSPTTISGQDGGEFSVQADGCAGQTLEQGSSCSLTVAFSPGAGNTGQQEVSLALTDNAGTQTVVLEGSAVSSLADEGLQASPPSLDFGGVDAGIGSLSLQAILDNLKTVTITNTGPKSVVMGDGPDTVTPRNGQSPAFYSLGNLSALGLDPSLYQEVAGLLDSCLNVTLAVGQSCNANVIFLPPAAGPYSGTLSLPTSAGTFSVPLAGSGVRFGLVSSPSSVHFGDVPLGSASVVHNLTLSMHSADLASLRIKNANFTRPNPGAFHYAQGNGCQLGTLESGAASCTVPLVFRPTHGGPESSDFQLDWQATTVAGATISGVLDVPLHGTGVVGSGTVSVEPTTLGFGPVLVGHQSILAAVVQNTSSNGAPVALYGSEVVGTGKAGSFPAEFSVFVPSGTSPCEGVVVPSGSACVIDVAFSPVVSGDANADLVIETSAGQETVALGGVGTTTPAPAVSLSTTSLSFATSGSPETITVTNSGATNSVLAISTVDVAGVNPGAFSIVSGTDTCVGNDVQAGASCSFQVVFDRLSTRPKNAEVLISDNAPGSPQVVSLSGPGARVVADLSPTSFAFPAVTEVIGTPVSQIFTVTNDSASTGDLSVAGAKIAASSPNRKSFSVPGAQDGCVDDTLAPGASCSFSVVFSPVLGAVGPLSATIDVVDSALNQPQQVSVTGTGVALPSVISGTGSSSTSVTTETEDGVTVSATGTGTFTLTWYGSTQPSSATTPAGFTSTGRFLDLYVSPGSNFSAITLEDCHLAGGTELWWYDAASGTWTETSGTYDATNGCWTLDLSGTSSPTIGELTGTVFDSGLPSTTPPPPPPGSGGGSGGGGSSFTPTTITSPTTNPTSSVGTITASGTGTGTITLNSFGDVPPSPTPALSDGMSYFTMELADSSVLSSLQLTDCGLSSGDTLWYWTGSGWAEVSPQSFDAAAGCITSTLTDTSAPTIADMLSTTVIFGVASPTPPTSTKPITVTQPSSVTRGYWLFGADGGVFSFGGAQYYGSVPQVLGAKAETLAAPITGAAVPAGGGGYWMVGSDGGVFAFGDAPYLGSLPGQGIVPSAPIVSILSDPTGPGYWLIGADGGVFTFGDARFFGSLPSEGQTPAGPIVSAAVMPDGLGYWLVSADGQVYAFGAAGNYGSTVSLGLHLAAPITSIVSTPDGAGYWLIGADGGVFTFGDASFFGSLPALGVHPAHPISAATMSASGGLYLTGGKLGGVFTLGSAPYLGSIPGLGLIPDKSIVAIEPSEGMG
jgi:hypothetical protein